MDEEEPWLKIKAVQSTRKGVEDVQGRRIAPVHPVKKDGTEHDDIDVEIELRAVQQHHPFKVRSIPFSVSRHGGQKAKQRQHARRTPRASVGGRDNYEKWSAADCLGYLYGPKDGEPGRALYTFDEYREKHSWDTGKLCVIYRLDELSMKTYELWMVIWRFPRNLIFLAAYGDG